MKLFFTEYVPGVLEDLPASEPLPGRAAKTVLRKIRRRLLADFLQCDPDELEISQDEGKPYIAGRDGFHFSTSYSGNAMALVCSARAIGIDMEILDPVSANEEAAESLFNVKELNQLAGKSGSDWTNTFYAIWTQKEAFAKALGEGFGIEFTDFAVSEHGGLVECARIETPVQWYSKAVTFKDRYALALATPYPVPEFEIQEIADSGCESAG